MIFITKKALNDEIEHRMAEISFKNRTDEKLYKLEASVRDLQFRLSCIEERGKTPVPKVQTGDVEATSFGGC